MGRSPCCDKNGLKKGPWTPEEDQKLVDYIQTHGSGNWRTLPKNAGLQRCGKSCRLRWTNYLRPDIKRGKFSLEEEETIIQLHSILGNKWSAIAARLPGRTDNEIKNYWNTHIRKRLLRMGIDPVTHNPRLDLLDLSSIYNHQFANPNSNFTMARLLGLQSIVNPELLKLATSLFSKPTQSNPINYPYQNPSNSEIQTSHPHCMPVSSSCEPINESFNQFQHYDNLIDVGSYDAQTQAFGDHLPNLLDTDVINQNNYMTTYDNTMFQSNDQRFGFDSMFSGPSSSSTPLHSNSNSNSTYIATEDERESYCSNFMMKFEIPADLLDVSEFM